MWVVRLDWALRAGTTEAGDFAKQQWPTARLLIVSSTRFATRDRAEERVKTLSLQELAESVHLVEKLCSFYHLGIHIHSCKLAVMGNRGGLAVGAKYIVRGKEDTTQTVLNIEREQGFSPWSPSQEGARDQSSSARQGLPSKGEARTLHHQPDPALTLTTPCFLLSALSTRCRNVQIQSKNPQLTKIW